MEGFLKIVFILFVLYYAVILFVRYALPWLLGRFIRKQQEKYFGQNQPFAEQPKHEKEKKTDPQKKKHQAKDDKTFGEYIDFEEVQE
ncbi:MAG: hypothetical protein Q8O72_10155 [Bacteroidales bacterium]|jgi:hypothetical protein|nr:hypothetical protein [Bacteroidales bacterium]